MSKQANTGLSTTGYAMCAG